MMHQNRTTPKLDGKSMVNIPAITASYCTTHSASVKCTWPDLLGTFFLMMVLLISLEFTDDWDD